MGTLRFPSKKRKFCWKKDPPDTVMMIRDGTSSDRGGRSKSETRQERDERSLRRSPSTPPSLPKGNYASLIIGQLQIRRWSREITEEPPEVGVISCFARIFCISFQSIHMVHLTRKESFLLLWFFSFRYHFWTFSLEVRALDLLSYIWKIWRREPRGAHYRTLWNYP